MGFKMPNKIDVTIEIKSRNDANQFKADQVEKADKNGGVAIVSLSGMKSTDMERFISSFFRD